MALVNRRTLFFLGDYSGAPGRFLEWAQVVGDKGTYWEPACHLNAGTAQAATVWDASDYTNRVDQIVTRPHPWFGEDDKGPYVHGGILMPRG